MENDPPERTVLVWVRTSVTLGPFRPLVGTRLCQEVSASAAPPQPGLSCIPAVTVPSPRGLLSDPSCPAHFSQSSEGKHMVLCGLDP